MTIRLRILPRALNDVQELTAYIAADSPAAAGRFRDATVATAEALLQFPEACPRFSPDHPTLGDIRKTHVQGFPNHLIFYSADQQTLTVERVLHGARDLPRALRPGAGETSQT